MGLFDKVIKFKEQDYESLKKDLTAKGTLFLDPEFPPQESSLSPTPGKHGNVVWKRPRELCTNPRLIVGEVTRNDIIQGHLGNCWFVAALSCLTSVKQYWHKVIVSHKDQEWNDEKPEEYRGIFRFRFWRYGEWTEVVVDDLLPTVDNKLVFIRSQNGGEFWSALLEKAYVKLFGSYEALDGGRLGEALEDFTGGVSDSLDLLEMKVDTDNAARQKLFTRLMKEMDRKTMMGASIPANSTDEMEAESKNGLIKGHAYSISAVRDINLKGSGLFSFLNREKIHMIRLHNPWGHKEWTGPFSDGSQEWQKITESDKKKVGLTKEDDGEFWMVCQHIGKPIALHHISRTLHKRVIPNGYIKANAKSLRAGEILKYVMTWEDFCHHFERLDTCTLVNTSILSLSKTWHEGLAHGVWRSPDRAGGCSNHPSFLSNPQYRFDVKEDDEEFMIHLMQKHTRDASGTDHKSIGYRIFRVEMNREYRVHDTDLHDVIPSKSYVNSRAIFSYHCDVKKGRYVIIPTTFEPNQRGEFLLRIYTSSSNQFQELTKEVPEKSCWQCCSSRPAATVISVKVVKARGLEKQDTYGGADPYCVIQCEGKKVRSRTVDNTINPTWEDSAIFYRKKMKKPLTVEVWNDNLLRNQFMGAVVLDARSEQKLKTLECNLFCRGKEKHIQKPGKIIITITQSTDLGSV